MHVLKQAQLLLRSPVPKQGALAVFAALSFKDAVDTYD